jgi:diguanylate cyclase (GGDEF)-like protein/PAS domain S-box-containing protein
MTMRSTKPIADAAAPRACWWVRLHRALMPDYNRKATIYWWLVVLSGGGILAVALGDILAMPIADLLVVLAGVALAMMAGLFPVRIPRWKNAFTGGEIFIFLLLLLHGPAAAAAAAAAEGLLGSLRTSQRWTSRLASPAMACTAMYSVGSALTAALNLQREGGLVSPGLLLLSTLLGALIYFLFNTLLTTAVFHLKRSIWPQAGDLIGNFGWIGITSVASALIASLLFLSSQQAGIGVLLAAAPIIALLLVATHYYFRQQAADEAARLSRLDAAEREARIAAAHVLELQASEKRFHSAFSDASIGMALVTLEACVLQANAALCDLLGYADGCGLETRPLSDFTDPQGAEVLLAHVKRLRDRQDAPFAVELRLRRGDGAERWATIHGTRFGEFTPETPYLILQIQDITARRHAEAELQHIAFHDSLTGLPNRHRFRQVLSSALAKAQSSEGKPFGLMFLDFDRFKLINDSLGHAAGDEFLVSVAKRIQQQLRPGDAVARLGGDEFAILAEDLECERYAVDLAGRLLAALKKPFRVAGSDISTSVSIGITFSGNGYSVPADMLRDADIAMYKAKASGKARYALFDSALHVELAHRMRLEGDLRVAVAAGHITVAYQPLFDLRDGRVTGFEALARWQHPELGAIEPEAFIPVAEEAGLMVPLTDYVLGTACRQLAHWQRRARCLVDLSIHVNLSSVDVAHPDLVGRVHAALDTAQLRPKDLTLELTENTLMKRLEGALPALTQLRKSGIGLSVDDFGTGYSSLKHLSNLPVNGLKLDRCFVADLERGLDDETIVRSIVMLGTSLGKTIMAEGIETAEQLARLKAAGCQAGQGYFLSRPLAAEQVDELLDRLSLERYPAPESQSNSAYSILQ